MLTETSRSNVRRTCRTNRKRAACEVDTQTLMHHALRRALVCVRRRVGVARWRRAPIPGKREQPRTSAQEIARPRRTRALEAQLFVGRRRATCLPCIASRAVSVDGVWRRRRIGSGSTGAAAPGPDRQPAHRDRRSLADAAGALHHSSAQRGGPALAQGARRGDAQDARARRRRPAAGGSREALDGNERHSAREGRAERSRQVRRVERRDATWCKWHALRAEVARALADVVAHVSPVSLLPRAPRKPSAFHPSTFNALSRELRREARGSGLVVLTGAQGSGRTELALTYAHEKHEDRTYDQVFVLRASDQLRLERDFLTMARILAPGAEHRAELRREALRHLETNSRWLIVFMSVNDPVILLPFLPWTTSGHVLCTIDARAVPRPAAEELWLRHFNVVPIDLETLQARLQRRTAMNALAEVVPRTLRSDERLEQIAKRFDDSRYAMALAEAVCGTQACLLVATPNCWQRTRPSSSTGISPHGTRLRRFWTRPTTRRTHARIRRVSPPHSFC